MFKPPDINLKFGTINTSYRRVFAKGRKIYDRLKAIVGRSVTLFTD